MRLARGVVFAAAMLTAGPAAAQAPVEYRLSFPQAEHRLMNVEVTFTEVPAGRLEIHMSRSSPGRYALHEFAKNVIDVAIVDGAGRPVPVTRPDLHSWAVTGHDGTVRVTYTIFGDVVDGTYFAVDSTHAHVNIPATLMWARGYEERPARVRVEPPAGSDWRVATQLFPTDDPRTFTAPNLYYLMDSPIEAARLTMREFSVELDGRAPGAESAGGSRSARFRVALHHLGTEAEADRYAADLEKIALEAAAVYGEFPVYEGGAYTFLTDCLPWASGDAMEHRNSTIVTHPGDLGGWAGLASVLADSAHELFHSWSVERIRPRSLEPFDFTDANVSGELWLAEGVTSYYHVLLMHRAGLQDLGETSADFAGLINDVTTSPGRRLRSAVEMSRLAPFVDAARAADRTNWDNTFISYYTWGAAIGLALDLSLRDRSDGRITLDDFMQTLWVRYGRPGGRLPGFVDVPYTGEDVATVLGDVSGDRSFADDFLRRYVEGHDVADYARLLARAGLLLRPVSPGEATIGEVTLTYGADGARVNAATAFGSPVYTAGLDRDDLLVRLDGERMTGPERLDAVLRRHRPGDTVQAEFVRRGERVAAALVLGENPRQEIVAAEAAGGTLTAGQRQFREAWLGAKSARDR